jgi:dolichyl-phosphate-mannose-protein mannosyltransferase
MMGRPAIVAVALGAILVVGGGLRQSESEAHRVRAVADEQAYVELGADLRIDGRYGDPAMHHPFHWAPATPALFAAAEVAGDGDDSTGPVPIAPRSAQVVVGTLAIGAAWALAALLAGPVVGLAAAAAVAFYPPLVGATDRLTSEPLGALTLTVAILALVWAWRGGGRRFAVAGAAFGVACLARADLLVVALLAFALVVALSWRPVGRASALARGGALTLGLALIVAPWIVFASRHTRAVVPITDGGASTLLVATYLPGNGTIFGFKHAFAAQARRVHPSLRHQPAWRITSKEIMDGVAGMRPGLSRDAALRAALRANLRRYVIGRPLAFAGLEARKLWRMWGSYYRGGFRGVHQWIVWLHRVLVALALAGLGAGLWRTRRPELAVALFVVLAATAVNVVFVAEPRHNVRLMPLLLAAGAAGWALYTCSGRSAGYSPRKRSRASA